MAPPASERLTVTVAVVLAPPALETITPSPPALPNSALRLLPPASANDPTVSTPTDAPGESVPPEPMATLALITPLPPSAPATVYAPTAPLLVCVPLTISVPPLLTVVVPV